MPESSAFVKGVLEFRVKGSWVSREGCATVSSPIDGSCPVRPFYVGWFLAMATMVPSVFVWCIVCSSVRMAPQRTVERNAHNLGDIESDGVNGRDRRGFCSSDCDRYMHRRRVVSTCCIMFSAAVAILYSTVQYIVFQSIHTTRTESLANTT